MYCYSLYKCSRYSDAFPMAWTVCHVYGRFKIKARMVEKIEIVILAWGLSCWCLIKNSLNIFPFMPILSAICFLGPQCLCFNVPSSHQCSAMTHIWHRAHAQRHHASVRR